jgi:biopolymer transport protein ExbB/TolQ
MQGREKGMIVNGLTEYFLNPTFIILALMSLYSVTVMLNQAWYLYSSREDIPAVLQMLANDDEGEKRLAAFIGSRNTPHRRLIGEGCKHLAKPAEALRALLDEETRSLRWEAEQRLAALGTIANVAPFIGLFGTVIGVIRAFQAIAVKASAGPSVVAGGIAEALFATAAGLFVAIPAVIAYNYFLKRSRKLSLELGRIATIMVHRGGT